MMEHKKIPTTNEVWACIRIAHPELKVFSTSSRPDEGYMFTAYCLPNMDYPLIAADTTWERGEKDYERVNEQHKFWLCIALDEGEGE